MGDIFKFNRNRFLEFRHGPMKDTVAAKLEDRHHMLHRRLLFRLGRAARPRAAGVCARGLCGAPRNFTLDELDDGHPRLARDGAGN